MTGLLLTHRFSTVEPTDEAGTWAVAHERGMRELRYREEFPEAVPPMEVSLAQVVPARDAGDVCGVCGGIVTWVDHLPPLDSQSAVRCFKIVRSLENIRKSFGYALNDPKHPDYYDTYADVSDMREDF